MSGNAAAQSVTGNTSPPAAPVSTPCASPSIADYDLLLSCHVLTIAIAGYNSTETSEKTLQNNLNIPSRSTSQQPPSSTPVPVTEPSDEPPSPRRGSKRSLITRSRQGSRSSRRSARNATKESKDLPPPMPQHDTSRTQKKQKSGGFLSFLNCCRGDDDLDNLKSEEADVPPKQRTIEPTPQRTAIPDEPSAPVTSEKMSAPETAYSEKVDTPTVADEKPITPQKSRENSRPSASRNEMSHERNTIPTAAALPVAAATSLAAAGAGEAYAHAESNRDTGTTVHDQVTGVTAVDEPSVPGGKPQLEFPPPPRDDARGGDVDMADTPIVPPVEEQNVVDEPVQPHDVQPVPLPPPPPLQKRMEATKSSDVPPVPDPEPESKQTWLLPPIQQKFKGRKCLILDLDETLVHSSFKILNQADFTIPVEIEGQYHNVYVIKRPGVDQFMKRVGELYEVVVFTASVSKYGDPLLDQLDIHHVVHHRLFRESCYNHQGNYVKVCNNSSLVETRC